MLPGLFGFLTLRYRVLMGWCIFGTIAFYLMWCCAKVYAVCVSVSTQLGLSNGPAGVWVGAPFAFQLSLDRCRDPDGSSFACCGARLMIS